MYRVIVEHIKHELESRQIPTAMMARELGLPQQTLDNILRGVRGMGARTFQRIMDRRPEWWSLLNGSANNNRTGSSPGKEEDPGA